MRSYLRLSAARLQHLVAIAGIAAAAGLLAFGWPAGGAAQTKEGSAKAPEPQQITLTTGDGLVLHGTYYKSTLGKNAAVIVLLHGKDGNRFLWSGDNGFAKTLQAAGYAVLCVDLRLHGESQPAGGVGGKTANQQKDKKNSKKGGGEFPRGVYEAMVLQDMEAIKQYVYEEHKEGNLNMNKMAIVGADFGALVAANYALVDWKKEPHPDNQPGYETPRGQDVRALVFISPPLTVPGLQMSKTLTELRNPAWGISMLVCVGKDDPSDKGAAQKIFELASTPAINKERMYKVEYKGKLRGTDLLGRGISTEGKRIEQDMLDFFAEHLKKVNSPWRDRESKLTKKRAGS
jgi:pimeloyl-ACP methyl ester carboxylesterase